MSAPGPIRTADLSLRRRLVAAAETRLFAGSSRVWARAPGSVDAPRLLGIFRDAGAYAQRAPLVGSVVVRGCCGVRRATRRPHDPRKALRALARARAVPL